jgi:hypothetical protein
MKPFLITLLISTALLSGCAVNNTHRALSGKYGEVSVIVFSSTDCPIANALAPEIERIHRDIQQKGGELILVHVWKGRNYNDASEHAKEYGLSMQVLIDSDHELVKQFNATVTPEAVVIRYDRKGIPIVVYQGLINNIFDSPGNRRDKATQHYVRDAIDAAYANAKVIHPYRQPTGCVIEQMQ